MPFYLADLQKGHGNPLTPLTGSLVTIGSSEKDSIPIYSQLISPSHAILTYQDGNWNVRNKSSDCDVYINNIKLPLGVIHILQDGDVISLGSPEASKINFRYQDTVLEFPVGVLHREEINSGITENEDIQHQKSDQHVDQNLDEIPLTPQQITALEPSNSTTHCPCMCSCVIQHKYSCNRQTLDAGITQASKLDNQLNRQFYEPALTPHSEYLSTPTTMHPTFTCSCVNEYMDACNREAYNNQLIQTRNPKIISNQRWLESPRSVNISTIMANRLPYQSLDYIDDYNRKAYIHQLYIRCKPSLLIRNNISPARLYEPLYPYKLINCPCRCHEYVDNCRLSCNYDYKCDCQSSSEDD